MLEEDVDMVAGDIDGASWRRRSGPDQQFECTLEEAFKNAKVPVPPSSTLGGAPEEFRANGQTYVGLSSQSSPKRHGSFQNMEHSI